LSNWLNANEQRAVAMPSPALEKDCAIKQMGDQTEPRNQKNNHPHFLVYTNKHKNINNQVVFGPKQIKGAFIKRLPFIVQQ